MIRFHFYRVFCIILLAIAVLPAQAQGVAGKDAGSRPLGTITPIFSQLLVTTLPAGFVPVFEQSNSTRYIRESVLKGETVDNWTQMITITGAKDIALNPSTTPKQFTAEIVAGYQRACASTFNARIISQEKINGYDAITVVAGCGRSPLTAGQTSEAALMITIKGEKDYYTIQWAKRGEPADKPFDIDLKAWTASLISLLPIRLCARIPGEATPYPSCIGK